MVQIVLIRPGSTDYDEQGRIQGTLDIPLSEQGAREVGRIIEEIRGLEIDTIYHAPCEAACQTAESLAEAFSAKLKKLDNLRNLDHGLWQGMLIDEVKHKQPKVFRQWQEQPEIICPPEGEMLSEAQDRAEAALTKILKKHKQGTLALVVPEPLASVVQGLLCHCEIGGLWKSGAACGSWEILPLGQPSLTPSQT